MRGIGGVAAGGAMRPGRTGGRGAGGFTVGQPGAAAAAGPQAAGAAVPVGLGLLALQEGGDAPSRDRSARRRAESILDELQALQCDLLRGGGDPGRLERLAALQSGEEGADPILRQAVQAIVLRARVELARRGWNGSVSTA